MEYFQKIQHLLKTSLRQQSLSARKYLRPRQKIIIPLTLSKSNQKSSPGIHIVRRGDTLWDIAKRYSTTVSLLIAKNYQLLL